MLLALGTQRLLGRLLAAISRRRPSRRLRFWARQGLAIATMLVVMLGLLSIWFEEPARLAAALGILGAGLAFALQRVVTALAGYVVILRGDLFTVGDRITMGGVRGDVISVDFMTTHIFEMGQPPTEQEVPPATWVRSRQPTGRIVSVSNARVFDEPICNYSREFAFIWEEISLPFPYDVDRKAAEHIMVEAARTITADIVSMAARETRRFAWRYAVEDQPVEPKVYYRLTDNWLELTVRFVTPVRGVRELKDELSRDILRQLDAVGIALAPTRLGIVYLPGGDVEPAREHRE